MNAPIKFPAYANEPASLANALAELDREIATTDGIAERISLIRSHIPGRIAFSTSLSIEDQAVLDAIARSKADIDVFTLDTGRHFPETLDVIATSEARYGIKIRLLAPEASEAEGLVASDGVFGFRQSIEARKACCDVRKVRPLRRALEGAAAWITGLRRGQSGGRLDTPYASFDAGFALIKLNPLADWPLQTLERYVAEHNVPVNELHARGFPSIGCQPCTRAIAPGEDIRAGRWWWESPETKECGLHKPSQKVAAASA